MNDLTVSDPEPPPGRVQPKRRMKIRIRHSGLSIAAGIIAATALWCVGIAPTVHAQRPIGHIVGTVRSAETGEVLPGASVTLEDLSFGASTDDSGRFVLSGMPPGRYTVLVRSIGYAQGVKTGVTAREGEFPALIEFRLSVAAVPSDSVTVSGAYFRKPPNAPVSVFQFNAEEVKHLPGSAGDISRILSILPSAARTSDRLNDLVVRGGSPFENGFYLDGIQIPNINHFPVQGSSAGPIGLLNSEFVKTVRFHTGGFPAEFGDRLSSIIDIDLREGRRDAIGTQLDLSIGGLGGSVEGPFPAGRGSWFVSTRRSFFELFEDALGLDVVPWFRDVHAKATYRLDANNSLSVLNIFAQNRLEWTRESSRNLGWGIYGTMRALQNTTGLSWRHSWGPEAYTVTSLSASQIEYDTDWHFTRAGTLAQDNTSIEGVVRLRSTSVVKLNERHRLNIGFELGRRRDDLDYEFTSEAGLQGRPIHPLVVSRSFRSLTSTVFANHIWSPTKRLTTTTGLRADYYCLTDRLRFSPRVAGRFVASSRLTVNAAAGLYFQELPIFILAQDDRYRDLRAPTAVHMVVGVDFAIRANATLTLEVYDKEYSNFPLEPENPERFIVDDGITMEGFTPYRNLKDNGCAYARGVELLLQRRPNRGLHYLLSGSLFRARYRDFEGVWRDRVNDNRYHVSALLGYRPSGRWTLSGRWNIAGGRPYTPFTNYQSRVNIGQLDPNRFHLLRYPTYHSLSLRVDARFEMGTRRLVAYLSVWNVTNRANVWFYYWNHTEGTEEAFNQWHILPIIGLRYEF